MSVNVDVPERLLQQRREPWCDVCRREHPPMARCLDEPIGFSCVRCGRQQWGCILPKARDYCKRCLGAGLDQPVRLQRPSGNWLLSSPSPASL